MKFWSLPLALLLCACSPAPSGPDAASAPAAEIRPLAPAASTVGTAPANASAVASDVLAASRWPLTPRRKADGGKWRIAYYEGGQYRDYEVILKATVRGLMALGWLRDMPLPADNNPQAGGFWRWLAANARSDYLEFLPDGYHAAGDFDPKQRPVVAAALLKRLQERRDIDLVIAMGTWAGQDLARPGISTPVVVMSTSNPVASGIVRSDDDSGFDHLHAKTEPGRYGRQLALFHDIFRFRKLGIVYEDSVEGRSFAAVDEIAAIAGKRGFAVQTCHAPFNGVSQQEAEARVTACYREIATVADAVYLTVHRGITPQSLPGVLEPLIARGLPTFSMLGEQEVRQGALMSIAQLNYLYVGRFHAETMARIFNGASPRALPQVWQAPAKIALNLETAERIGYNPPVDILMASDEIYARISPPPAPR
ncbi:ABC transporter substrate-binding protein [Chitinilyticum litopenaei]|uniref:ABC transporter substrate-binding protein n=1 Tax=Chitinilyticum litopenaei TaxID=1121276 RepID=UPI00042A5040|nr:ABC transporter substrate binding protein [Chitinilyticum litopenaei]